MFAAQGNCQGRTLMAARTHSFRHYITLQTLHRQTATHTHTDRHPHAYMLLCTRAYTRKHIRTYAYIGRHVQTRMLLRTLICTREPTDPRTHALAHVTRTLARIRYRIIQTSSRDHAHTGTLHTYIGTHTYREGTCAHENA